MELGDRLAYALELRGVSRNEVAVKVNVAPNTISGYIVNKRRPDYETLKRIAAYLDISTDYLLGTIADIDTKHGKLTSEEAMLIDMYRLLDTKGQEMLMEVAQAAWKYSNPHSTDTTSEQTFLNIINDIL